MGHKDHFDELTDIGTALMALVGDDDAQNTADKLGEIADRYSTLVEDSEALGKLLANSKDHLRQLVLGYEDLLAWLQDMEGRLSKYRVLSVHTEKLLQQMDELTVSILI